MPRTGVTLWGGEGATRSQIVEFVQLVEALGYDSIWVGEAWGRDVFTLLTHAAVNTKNIKLASGIVNIYSRTPATIAQTIASLDEISSGRVILGIGTSGPIVIENWHGIKYERPLQRTREYVEVIKLILSGERVNYDGQIFRLRNFRLGFTPPRKDIPIFIASMGPQNLRMTGEVADGCIPFFPSAQHMSYYLTELGAGAQRAGRDPSSIDIAPYTLSCVSEDRERARTLARHHIAYYVGGMGTFYNKLVQRYGFVEEAKAIQQAWANRDREGAALKVSDKMVDTLTLAGTPSECRERLEAYRQAGVTLPIIHLVHGSTPEMVRQTLETLAQ